MPDNFTCQEEGAATQWVNNKVQFQSNGCLTQGRILVEIVGAGCGKNLGEVSSPSSRPPWKVRGLDMTYACM